MKDNVVSNIWKEFIESDEYKKYFTETNEDVWKRNLEILKQFLDKNERRPGKNSGKEERAIFTWTKNQVTKYKEKSSEYGFVHKSKITL